MENFLKETNHDLLEEILSLKEGLRLAGKMAMASEGLLRSSTQDLGEWLKRLEEETNKYNWWVKSKLIHNEGGNK